MTESTEPSVVTLSKSSERKVAIATAIESLGGIDCQGKDIYLKCSYNSADLFPASTHPEMLSCIVEYLRSRSAGQITLVERSGMGLTREIWKRLGVTEIAKQLEIHLLALEDLHRPDWRHLDMAGSHWKRGIEVPSFLRDDVYLVQVCNLKTHRFGGHISASLKNSLGLIAKHSVLGGNYNYMTELHGSPDQRLMIAEVNQAYVPRLVVMDATEVFINGGPERGDLASPRIIAASKDRVAIDAVGSAILRAWGASGALARNSIFDQDQIKRASELKLGALSGNDIRLVASDPPSSTLALQIKSLLSVTTEEKKP